MSIRMQLLPFENEDFSSLYDFMAPIWKETYADILPMEQIEFLLDKYFSKKGIRHFLSLGYIYRKIDDVGVLVFVERENELYLDKLYLLPSARGKNYPQFVFAELAKYGKDITLNVNQSNERALQCYLKNGFKKEKEMQIPLENGMTNCDYFLRKRVDKHP